MALGRYRSARLFTDHQTKLVRRRIHDEANMNYVAVDESKSLVCWLLEHVFQSETEAELLARLLRVSDLIACSVRFVNFFVGDPLPGRQVCGQKVWRMFEKMKVY